MKKLIVTLLVAVLLSGCATTFEVQQPYEQRLYYGNYYGPNSYYEYYPNNSYYNGGAPRHYRTIP